MTQTTTLINAIIEFLFGKKYFANVINTRGTDRCEISSFIFSSSADAQKHRQEISSTASYQWIETISFRSRIDYASTVKRYNSRVK